MRVVAEHPTPGVAAQGTNLQSAVANQRQDLIEKRARNALAAGDGTTSTCGIVITLSTMW
ncbi:MAG: hypothetical protein R2706_08295 [Acidimicrobiales bacterium]